MTSEPEPSPELRATRTGAGTNASFDDAQLAHWGHTYEAVIAVQDDYQRRALQAGSQAEIDRLQSELVRAVVAKMNERGYSRQRFEAILHAIQSDPELRLRIRKIMDAEHAKQHSAPGR